MYEEYHKMTNAKRIIKIGNIFNIATIVPDDVLIGALTTPAYGHEKKLPHPDVQRYLALIGDAVIDIVVIEHLMKKGLKDPGQITIEKSNLVGVRHQRKVASKFDLQDYMLWGVGELKEEKWESRRGIGECLEAIIGAIYRSTNDIDICERSLRRINYFQK